MTPRKSIRRRFAGVAFAAFAALTSSISAKATPSLAEGVWRTQDGAGVIVIQPCAEKLCGYAADAPHPATGASGPADQRASLSEGQRLLSDFTGGPDLWTGGSIRDPRDGRRYKGSLRLLDRARLKITGCLVGVLCGSETWTRIR